jgi:hypothetical protein
MVRDGRDRAQRRLHGMGTEKKARPDEDGATRRGKGAARAQRMARRQSTPDPEPRREDGGKGATRAEDGAAAVVRAQRTARRQRIRDCRKVRNGGRLATTADPRRRQQIRNDGS